MTEYIQKKKEIFVPGYLAVFTYRNTISILFKYTMHIDNKYRQ